MEGYHYPLDSLLDNIVVKRVLMIAFQFPPMAGTSGMQRTLNFANYLLEHNWEPTVLTVSPMAYVEARGDQLSEIENDVKVVRTWAWDTARHLSIRGKYLGTLAQPDRWTSWRFSAIPVGALLHWRNKYDAIWSTYPIATTHMVARRLKTMTGLPWISDFRDMMYDDSHPEGEPIRRQFKKIESHTIRASTKVVVTTPGTLDLYKDRYPSESTDKFNCIRNGFDERNFQNLPPAVPRKRPGSIKIVHSGSLHPQERNPEPFFAALAQLRDEGLFRKHDVEITLRATHYDDTHSQALDRFQLKDIVELAPSVAYADALSEIVNSDGLLLVQGEICDLQVPAKIYEYFRAGRPIFALTDPSSDTAKELTSAGQNNIASISDTDQIRRGLRKFIIQLSDGTADVAPPDTIQAFDRRYQTSQLATLLNEVVASG